VLDQKSVAGIVEILSETELYTASAQEYSEGRIPRFQFVEAVANKNKIWKGKQNF
jgi:hypothetical protein